MVVSPNVNEQVTARLIISIGWKRPRLCPLSVSWVFPPLPLLPFHLSLSVSAFVASTAGLRPRQGGKKRILFIYSSVIWGRQACRTGEKHREAFCIQRSVHRAYRGACPWQSQHSDQGHFGRNRNATCLAPPVTWTGQHRPQSRNWAACSKHFSQDCLQP